MSIPEPGRLDLSPQRGDPYRLELQFRSTPGQQALNLRDHGFVAQVWGVGESEANTDFEIVLLDPSTGRVALELSVEQSEALPADGWWDLLVVEPGGVERIWLRGRVVPL